MANNSIQWRNIFPLSHLLLIHALYNPCSHRGVKKKRIILIAILLLVVAGLAIHFLRPKEPSYQSKTLTEWLKEHEAERTVSKQAVSERAIEAIGTNATPTLLTLLTAKDLPGVAPLQASVEGLGWTNIHAFDATYKRRLATTGFLILGPAAKSATPQLVELARTGRSPLTRLYALWCLEKMKAGKEILLPLWTQSLGDADQETAKFAAEQLYKFSPEEAKKAGAYKFLPYLNPPATNASASK
ncbi:MAG: domain containing protein [Pedosphaera sp.]|nr:domain containing protein [Pedosphaera sp.]